MMIRKRSLLWIFLSVLFISIVFLWWVIIGFLRDYQSIPSHHLIGNQLSNVAALKEEGVQFSFLVVGDTRGSEAAETLIEMALKKDRSSFMIILGDFVKKPDIWNHRFFLTEMTAEINPSFPVFLVSGNHDIDYSGSKIKRIDRRVTPEIYESLYGARNFDFIFNDCLFIICGVNRTNSADFISYLNDVLSRRSSGKRHIFVFVHYPPKGLARHIPGSMPVPHEEAFFSLLETFKVTACFFGDYHGYWRGQKNGVAYIVSGGGGGRLKGYQPQWGKFHHILKITVEPEKFVEEIITVKEPLGLEDKFEEWVFTNIFPLLGTSIRVYCLVFIGFAIIAGYCLFKLIKAIQFPS